MATPHSNTSARLKLLVAVIIAAVFLLGVAQVIQGQVDTAYYRAQAAAWVKEKTGMDMVIRGQVTVSLLPSPVLYISGVELRGQDKEMPVPALSVDVVQVHPSLASVFSGAPEVAAVTLEHPVIEIARAQDGHIHWGWLTPSLAGALAREKPVAMAIVGGGVTFHDAKADKSTEIYAISARGAPGDLKGAFTLYGRTLQFTAALGQGEAQALPLQWKLFTDEKNLLAFDGTLNLSPDTLALSGNVRLQLENVPDWLKPKREEKRALIDEITGRAAAPPPPNAVPLSVSGAWKQQGDSVALTVDKLSGLGSEGKGEITATWAEGPPKFTASLDFSTLSYDPWADLAAELMKLSPPAVTESASQENPIPADVEASVALSADKVLFGTQTWENTHLAATLEKASVTINRFEMHVPGESSLSLFGIISHSNTRGLRFEGNMEAEGKSLREGLSVIDASALDLPMEEFGHFYVRSNLYVSPDQLRLSEADAKIGDLRLNGGLVVYYDAQPRLEADVKLRDINFDYFRDNWRKQKQNGRFFLQYDKAQSFNWLKKLQASINFKVTVDRFTLLERSGDSASFRIFAQSGEFGVYNARFHYPGDTLEAGFTLDVKGERPMVNLLLNASALDTAYFQAEKQEKPPAESKSRWPETLIDMGWMEGIDGVFDISLGKLALGGKTFPNLKTNVKLQNNQATLQTLTFDYWQGKCAITGSMYGGKVPGLSLAFTIYSVELKDMLDSLIGRDNVSGKASVSGKVATSGVNLLSWVSQAEGEAAFSGRGVSVEGFNLQGVIDAVSVSRTAADVFNNVNRSLVKGATQLSVDGNINLKDGVARTPGITLKWEGVTGNLTGNVKLIPWTMELSSFFQFPSFSSETVPTMAVQLAGSIDDPHMEVDMASLEAYVVKRLVGN